MIKDIVLEINGRDFSKRLSTFHPDLEVTNARVITTIDGTEHGGGERVRDVVTFKLYPSTAETALADFQALSGSTLTLTCTCPTAPGGTLQSVPVRLASNLTNAFGLNSVDGNIYYKGSDIVLRAVRVR